MTCALAPIGVKDFASHEGCRLEVKDRANDVGDFAHMADGDVHGPDGWIEFTKRVGAGMTDLQAGSDEVIESGELIGERWWIHATRDDGTPVRWRGITVPFGYHGPDPLE